MKRDIRFVSLILLFAGIFAMSLFVTMAGDDFFYATFAKNGLGHFFEAHADHYLHTNGRCIVHLLASVFLWLPHIFWVVANAFMWTAAALNLYRLFALYVHEGSKLRLFMFMLCGAFLTVHTEMAKESSLWLTGSFNYTYPLTMLSWFAYLLFTHEKQSAKKLCIVGFLAAASMEQESALAVLLAAGYIYLHFPRRGKKTPDKLKKAMIAVAAGAVSLFLAPGNLARMGDEMGASAGTFDNIMSGIDFMLNYCISSNYMIWVSVVFTVCCAVYLFKAKMRIFLYLLPLEIAALILTNHSGNFEWLGAFYSIIFAFSRIYYFACAVIAAYAYFVKKKNPLPLMALFGGIFSCAFIVFSPTLGARVILFAEVMIIFSAASLLTELLKRRTLPYAAAHLLILALSVWNVVYVTSGFYRNSVVFAENERLIEEWHKTGRGELRQKQYRNDEFEHSMPYNSEYHDGRYKEYYDIPIRVNIIWE